MDLTFQLTGTNNEGTISEPDIVTITVIPVATPPSEEEPQTMYDIIKDIIKNPLDITNSVGSSHKIIDILTDSNCHNGRLAFDLIGDWKGNK